MTRYLKASSLALAAAMSAAPALAQTIDFDGTNVVVDQLTPPGGRCVPPFANTVSFGPGDIRSDGSTTLGPISVTASHCVTSLPPTDIVDGRATIAFRAGDTITGTFSGRADTTATPGTFAVMENFVITGGTGRFVGATGTFTDNGTLSIAMGMGTFMGVIDGQITASASTATGNFATAQGAASAALGDYATAFGGLAIANGVRSAAFGSQAEATAVGATAIGDQTIASGPAATALGQLAVATAPAATALGHNSVASALASTAVGVRAAATGVAATAVGRFAAASGANATALGSGAAASFANSTAVGSGANSAAPNATALGAGALANAAQSIAIGGLNAFNGRITTAAGPSSLAIGAGAQTTAAGIAAIAIGPTSTASGDGATAVGPVALASAAASTALGRLSVASGIGSAALGNLANASADGSVALGQGSVANQAGTVSVGAVGSERRVVNLAAGTAATDAVNMSQLSVLGASLGNALAGLQSDTGLLFDLRSRDRNDFKRGIAAATAMGQASFPSAPGKTSYVLNGATFRGEAAVGGSLMHRFDTDTPIAVGVGFSFAGKKNNAFRAGVAGEF